MDKAFAQAHQISLKKLPYPAFVVVIDGRPIAFGKYRTRVRACYCCPK